MCCAPIHIRVVKDRLSSGYSVQTLNIVKGIIGNSFTFESDHFFPYQGIPIRKIL